MVIVLGFRGLASFLDDSRVDAGLTGWLYFKRNFSIRISNHARMDRVFLRLPVGALSKKLHINPGALGE
jgi:hypothetical protein